MKKIPTLFKRVFSPDHKTKSILPEVTPGCEAVLEGLCIPTVKWDGACCAIINGEIYKRYDAKVGKNGKQKKPPEGAIPCQPEPDPITGHWPHWVECDPSNPADKYFLEAFENSKGQMLCRQTLELLDGTYEAVGPSFQSNPYEMDRHYLIPHGWEPTQYIRKLMKHCASAPDGEEYIGREYKSPEELFEKMKKYLGEKAIEGIVFWLDDQPLCKIKRSDFGFEWPIK